MAHAPTPAGLEQPDNRGGKHRPNAGGRPASRQPEPRDAAEGDCAENPTESNPVKPPACRTTRNGENERIIRRASFYGITKIFGLAIRGDTP